MSNNTQRQSSWKTMLIIGIVSLAIWLFGAATGTTNPIDGMIHSIAGVAAFVGLLAGIIMLIQSRKD